MKYDAQQIVTVQSPCNIVLVLIVVRRFVCIGEGLWYCPSFKYILASLYFMFAISRGMFFLS